MKIEKINDFQIRCTLTSNDLASRGIRVGELAYGTDRARGLFQEIMQSAREQYDFQTDDLPVMVEAIPISSECMVLVITVSEDPEELDTRFSSFAPSVMNDEDEEEDMEEEDVFEDLVHDDDISSLSLNAFRKAVSHTCLAVASRTPTRRSRPERCRTKRNATPILPNTGSILFLF